MTEENKTKENWMENELNELGTQTETIFEKLPALKLEENKIATITVDCREKFPTWETTGDKGEKVVKAIIRVTKDGEPMNWWLNKKNPIYRQILEIAKGQESVIVQVMQTGTKNNTKYILVR